MTQRIIMLFLPKIKYHNIFDMRSSEFCDECNVDFKDWMTEVAEGKYQVDNSDIFREKKIRKYL